MDGRNSHVHHHRSCCGRSIHGRCRFTFEELKPSEEGGHYSPDPGSGYDRKVDDHQGHP